MEKLNTGNYIKTEKSLINILARVQNFRYQRLVPVNLYTFNILLLYLLINFTDIYKKEIHKEISFRSTN